MSSKVVTASTTAATVFTAPYIDTVRIRGIECDHRGTATVKLTMQDVFTPTASAGTTIPGEQIKARKIWSLTPGEKYTWMDDEKSIKILGTCKILSDITDANCNITVLW